MAFHPGRRARRRCDGRSRRRVASIVVRRLVIAVSNSSPLILYAGIGRLDLLGRVFTEVIVPPAVWEEVVAEGAGRPGAVEVARMPWIRRRALDHQGTALALLSELGPGEAEAIALRLKLGQPGPLLLDDRKGRRIAR